MANGNKQEKPHAIMVSFHLQGHIVPFVNLAINLAKHGFSITFAHMEHIHHKISSSHHNSTSKLDIFSESRESGLDIHYTTISDGFPVTFDRDNNFDHVLESFENKFPEKVDEFIRNLIQSRSSSAKYFLVSDTFATWSVKIANKYGLVNVSFWTEPALVFSLYYHLELLRQNGHVPVDGQQQNVDYIPGIKSINTKDFMSYLHDSDLTLLHKVIFRAFDLVKSADFILCNTVEELEDETIKALKQKQPIYAVGPLFPTNFKQNTVPKSLLHEHDCTEWLNKKEDGSVLYISFGSLAMIDKMVIAKIANGLLLSGVDFIWVLCPGAVDKDWKVEFEVRAKARGLIVPWCNQIEVLSNPAIGGFLTHCGWNSIMESMWCGVPMLCYPVFTDQPTNRKLVVEDWRVGMNLQDGESVTSDEVAEKIKWVVSGEKSENLKQEIKKVRVILENALRENGSSWKSFDYFVQDVLAKIWRI